MRREFDKSLLPKDAPKKGEHLKKQKRQRKCSMIRELLWDWRRQAGEEFTLARFAAAIGCKEVTVKRYFYGYIPHRDLHRPIARYFSTWNRCSEEVLYHDLRSTWHDVKMEKK